MKRYFIEQTNFCHFSVSSSIIKKFYFKSKSSALTLELKKIRASLNIQYNSQMSRHSLSRKEHEKEHKAQSSILFDK